MKSDIKKNPQMKSSYGEAPYMTDEERKISFLNRYFIYKKVRKVSDAEKVSLNLQHKYVNDEKYNKEETKAAQKEVRDTLSKPKTTRKETTKKKDKTAATTTIAAVDANAVDANAVDANAVDANANAVDANTVEPVKKKTVSKLPKKLKL